MVLAVSEDVISVCTGSLFQDLPEGLRNMMKNLAKLVISTQKLEAAFQSCGLKFVQALLCICYVVSYAVHVPAFTDTHRSPHFYPIPQEVHQA